MRGVALMLLFAFTSLMLASETDRDLTKKIEVILRQIETLRPGMTRADVLRYLTTEGGLSTRRERRYVAQSCRYIKVDVQFEAVGTLLDFDGESPADKITHISKPFLEFAITD